MLFTRLHGRTIPAFAGTTRYFPLFWQLLVVEAEYLTPEANADGMNANGIDVLAD